MLSSASLLGGNSREMSFPRSGNPVRSGGRRADTTLAHPRAAAKPKREGGGSKLRGKGNNMKERKKKKKRERFLPPLGSRDSQKAAWQGSPQTLPALAHLQDQSTKVHSREASAFPLKDLPSDAKISVYLTILLFTPGAGRLWQELFCYSM